MPWLTLLIKSGIVLVLFSITFIDGFENLALRRPAWEQHPWPYTDKDYGSQNAVDGDYSDRSAAGGQCSISADNNYTEASWGVDLGEVVSISHIDIFYRTDNEKKCSLGYYGQNCLQQCSKNCYVTSRCDRVTGRCDRGCKSGWTTVTCDQKCDIGFFGPDCQYKCGHCLNVSHCHHINGSCLNGCSKGYKGGDCKESCSHEYFGVDCLHKCSTYCSGNGSCNPFTGVCDNGCKDGWMGLKCGTPRITDKPDDNSITVAVGVSFGLGIPFLLAIILIYRFCTSKRKMMKKNYIK